MPESVLYRPDDPRPGCAPVLCPRVVWRPYPLPALKLRNAQREVLAVLPARPRDGTLEVWHRPGCLAIADVGEWEEAG